MTTLKDKIRDLVSEYTDVRDADEETNPEKLVEDIIDEIKDWII